MRDKRWAWIVIYALATAVFAAGVIVLVHDKQADSQQAAKADELPDLAPMPFASDLSVQGPATGSVGSQVSLRASGYSKDGVDSVDLYDGARRVATVTPPKGSSSAPITYPALSGGQHLLHAQITDKAGKQSLTPPVTVEVHAAQGTENAAVTLTADKDETPQELADRVGVSVDQLAAFPPGATGDDPQVQPDQPIPAGSTVTAIVPADNGIAEEDGKEVTVTNPKGSASPRVRPNGRPLTLTGAGSGCTVSLTSKGANGTVFYFEQNAGVAGWAAAGQTDGDGTLKLPAQTPGMHVFFARTDAEKSEPVSFRVPYGCTDQVGWTGNSTLVDGIVRSPASTKLSTYVLVSVDDAPWVRIPADRDRGLTTAGVKDIRQYLPALSGKKLSLEVWERSNEFTDKIGQGKLVVPDGQTLTDIIGEPGALRLDVQNGNPTGSLIDYTLGDQDETLTFKWQSASSRVDEVMWQVLSVDHGQGNTELTPPYLLAAGVSKRSTEDDTGTGGAGAFQIDTADIPGHEPPNPDKATTTPGGPTPGMVLLKPAVTPRTVAALGKGSFAQPITDKVDVSKAFQLPQSLPGEGGDIYVRVVANPKGPAVAAASPALRIVLPVAQSIKNHGSVSMAVDSTTLTLGRPANPALTNCVDITVPWPDPRKDKQKSVDFVDPFANFNSGYVSPEPGSPTPPVKEWTAQDQLDMRTFSLMAFYPVSGTYCLSDFPPPEKCSSFICDLYYAAADAFEFAAGIVGQLYDLVAYAYNGVISGVVFAIANFNPICVALKSASTKAGSGCAAVVGVAARSVITAVLAAYGLPPSLPERGELAGLVQGDLEGLAVELMKQAGIPCDDISSSPELSDAIDGAAKASGLTDGGDSKSIESPCKALAHVMIKTMKEEVETAAAAKVSQASGLPSGAGIPGFSMVPAAKGVGKPAELRVKMHLQNPNADGTGAVCRLAVRDAPFGDKKAKHLYELYTPLYLTEDDPKDGKGSWSGVVYIPPVSLPDYGNIAQGASVTMHGRREFPSNCTHSDITASGVIPKYEPR